MFDFFWLSLLRSGSPFTVPRLFTLVIFDGFV